jgi:predicted nucleic acid-binding protein
LHADWVLIDERKGYKAAQQRGLKVITALGILEEATHRDLVDFEKAVERLEVTSFYVSDDVLEEFRRRVRERTLDEEK